MTAPDSWVKSSNHILADMTKDRMKFGVVHLEVSRKEKSLRIIHPPINTFGQPNAMVPAWLVGSPIRAAGFPPINTVAEPPAIVSGGPTHVHVSPVTAAGSVPINTLGIPGPTIGPPTCGIGDGKAGVCIGQVCISVILAAGGIIYAVCYILSFI